MPDYRISLPEESELLSRSGWTQSPTDKDEFTATRMHFVFADQGVADGVFYGDVHVDVTVPEGGTRTFRRQVTKEVEVVRENETFQQALSEDVSVESLKVALSTEAHFAAIRGSASAKADLIDTFRREFKVVDRNRAVVRQNTGETVDDTVTVKGGDTRQFVPRTYKRHTWHLYLAYVDHLTVNVRRTLGVRHRVETTPKLPKNHGQGRNWYRGRPNVMPCHVPIAAISIWELMPESFPVVAEGYDRAVKLPDALVVDEIPPEDVKHHDGFRPKANFSLYEIAYRVFRKRR